MNKINANQKKILIVILLIIIAITIYILIQKQNNQISENYLENELIPYDEENNETKEENIEEDQIIIHITGAIKNEGVYT